MPIGKPTTGIVPKKREMTPANPGYYPRDLRGYGANPPDPQWPDGAHIAVQFVVNYEEGGENCVLHGDAASECFLSEITGAQPWPGQRHWNMESIYEYGARAGFWRLHRLFAASAIRPTCFGVASALARSPEQVAAMQEAKWEIASHGLKWIDYRDHSREAERRDMAEAMRIHALATGERPQGWYTGRCSINTVDMIARDGGFAWCADAYDDDLPWWYDAHLHGDNAEANGKPLLIAPYTLDANDMRFAITAGFDHAEPFYRYLCDSFDALHAEGRRGRPAMMSIGLHCRIAGRPGRIGALSRFIDHVQRHEKVWTPTRGEIAAHWMKTHPYAPFARPSRMTRAEFVGKFGGVYEHSPFVAERAWTGGLGPANDSAAGLAGALAQAFRAASADERLGVLKAHPDLAGKLAAAKRLTRESTEEQSGAGLDALTDAERQTFAGLNDAYVAKFGFPFIIAVRGKTKAEILAAFRERISHDRDAEFAEACRQVERIAALRLKTMLPE